MPKNPDIEKNNPCLKEHNLVYKCLNENDYIKEKCDIFFHNYNTCKHFWGFVQSYRRSKGIRPLLPPVEEREQIKTEMFEEYKKKSM